MQFRIFENSCYKTNLSIVSENFSAAQILNLKSLFHMIRESKFISLLMHYILCRFLKKIKFIGRFMLPPTENLLHKIPTQILQSFMGRIIKFHFSDEINLISSSMDTRDWTNAVLKYLNNKIQILVIISNTVKKLICIIYFYIIMYDYFHLLLPLRVLGPYFREYRIITLLTSKYFFDDTLVMNNHLWGCIVAYLRFL